MRPADSMVDVAIYIPSLGGGGAERVMVTLANGFVERGLRVDLVLARAEGPYLSEVAAGVRVVDLGNHRILASLPALVRYLRSTRPSSMLSALTHVNVIAVVARLLARVPTRLVVSERATYSLQRLQATTLRARILTPLMRWAYPRADAVVAVSRGVADDLAQAIGLPAERIAVAYNPVVTSALLEQANAPVHHPWVADGQFPIVLGVGRLSTEKGFSTLIQAFAKVRSQRPCRLVILGEGELRAELETLIAEHGLSSDVLLPGFVVNPFAWMRRASLFVLPSIYEGLPNALIQAMACGTPVVSADCPSGPMEILEGGKWGRLVPVGDVDAMADAIAATLSDVQHPDVARRAQDFGLKQALASYLCVLNVEK